MRGKNNAVNDSTVHQIRARYVQLLSEEWPQLKTLVKSKSVGVIAQSFQNCCFVTDAALIPLIEDLFKELAMIETCNKVRSSWSVWLFIFKFSLALATHPFFLLTAACAASTNKDLTKPRR